MSWIPAVATLLLALLAGCGSDPAATAAPSTTVPAGVAVRWNALVLDVAEAEDGFLTLKGVRTAAMMHLAMHDALQAIEPRYATFASSGDSSAGDATGADPEVAASEAAYAVVLAQYPDRDSVLSVERRRWVEDGARVATTIGVRAAAAVLAAREGDGWNRDSEYAFHPMGPGVYAEFDEHSGTPEGFVFGAGWAEARPFVLDRPDEFRSPPPPAIGSEAYARAFDEVKEVGAAESATRTADQAHLAMWWKQFVEKSHNRLGRELVDAEGLDLWEAARFFALVNMSVFDGYVASFDGKFAHNHWRPYTAIRWAAHDGNPATEPDPDWTNLHDHTYAFPSYPSAHGTVCAAAMAVFEDVFGQAYAFDMTIREADSGGPMSDRIPMDPATRSFASFREAAAECAMSRVYLGIHFRYDSEEGVSLGAKVGRKVTGEALPPS